MSPIQVRPSTLAEIARFVVEQGGCCYNCGRLLDGNISSHDDPGGVEVLGFEARQRVLFHCRSCGTMTPLEKVLWAGPIRWAKQVSEG